MVHVGQSVQFGAMTKYKSNIVSMAQLITGDERVLAMTGERTE